MRLGGASVILSWGAARSGGAYSSKRGTVEMAFDYSSSPDPIRDDLAEAHRRAWRHIEAPGTWLNGAERVAVAEETRRARTCALCAERKGALSPDSVAGEHAPAGVLPAALVEEVHRVTTDPARLTRAWRDRLIEEGITDEAYVEALGVAVLVISVDEFHRALDLPLEPLPESQPGDPTRVRPEGLVEGDAWVPMIGPGQVEALGLEGLPKVPGARLPNVLRGLSLVPEEVRAWLDLSASQYLPPAGMRRFETEGALDRSQIELVAGRVSALNECFY